MALEKWAAALGLWFQEAATELSHSDIRKALGDCLDDTLAGQYAYVCDVFGDDQSGDVVYSSGGDFFRAPYEMGMANGKRTCTIDTENALDVLPRTVYDPEADEADHYASMAESDQRANFFDRFPGSAGWKHRPFTERFISKTKRDAMPAADFAGKNQSFPIDTQDDVDAAFRSLGRAGADNYSVATIRSNIIKIAKRKGLKLPKSVDKQEAALPAAAEVKLVESKGAIDSSYRFQETDAVNPLAKIIDAGRGSSGYYSREVLMRDGPKIFGPGTLMFVNHATAAEEAARPEGDWNNLAAVTVGNAYWDDSGKEGAGLYAPAKVFSDYAKQVAEKAPYTGLSIRAGGVRDNNALGADGKPGVITSLTHAESIDFVTKAGRGGKLLTEAAAAVRLYEAAHPPSNREGENDAMTEAEVKKLIEASNAPLLTKISSLETALAVSERQRVGRGAIIDLLEGIKLPVASKQKIASSLATQIPVNEAGAIDTAALKALVEKGAKEEAAYLVELGIGGVQGLGESQSTPVELKLEDVMKETETQMARITGDPKVAKIAAEGRAA